MFLNGLAEQLDRDGFTEKQDARFVVRSIQDIARELLEQASEKLVCFVSPVRIQYLALSSLAPPQSCGFCYTQPVAMPSPGP